MRIFFTQSRPCIAAEFDEDLHAIAATVKGRTFIILFIHHILLLLCGTSELRVIVIEGYSAQQRRYYHCRVMPLSCCSFW